MHNLQYSLQSCLITEEVDHEPFSEHAGNFDFRSHRPTESNIDPYFYGVADSFTQIVDGRMAYIGDVRDDLPLLIGRKGIALEEWAALHKKELINLA